MTDYSELAPGYERRYRDRDYGGIGRALCAQFAAQQGCVVEVGCGTGHWTALLAREGVETLGLDPSSMMLRQRLERRGRLLRASAEHLPLATGACAGLFVVNALHHFRDRAAFAREAARVLAPGASLAVVTLAPHRHEDRWGVYDYWPETLTRDLARYPERAALRDAWIEAGLSLHSDQVVEHLQEQRAAEDVLAHAESVKRSTSQLADLSDEEFAAGLSRIRAAIAASPSAPTTLQVDLRLHMYVFTRRR